MGHHRIGRAFATAAYLTFAAMLIAGPTLGGLGQSPLARAATPIYVNGTAGNDAWDGTSPTYVSGTTGPKKTIQAGIAAVDAGGTVYVAAGTYHESAHSWVDVEINKPLSLSRSQIP